MFIIRSQPNLLNSFKYFNSKGKFKEESVKKKKQIIHKVFPATGASCVVGLWDRFTNTRCNIAIYHTYIYIASIIVSADGLRS